MTFDYRVLYILTRDHRALKQWKVMFETAKYIPNYYTLAIQGIHNIITVYEEHITS